MNSAAQPTATSPSPEQIFETLNLFHRTFALKAAIDLGIFTAIAQGARTPDQLSAHCHADARGMRILCDAMCVMEFLTKHDSEYQLTSVSAVFLDQNSPAYMGTLARFLVNSDQVGAFSKLTESARKGGTALPGDGAMEPDYPIWVEFARSMVPIIFPAAQALAGLMFPAGSERQPAKVLDVAAGHGMFGIQVALRKPEAQVYALDWAPVLKVAEENAAKAGVGARVHSIKGDAFKAEIGGDYDWVLLPNFLHHFGPEACEVMLARTRAALKPGGRIAIVEFVVDPDRLGPPVCALFPLIMLAVTPDGDAYTYSELDAMCRKAGFARTEMHPLPPGVQSAIIAYT